MQALSAQSVEISVPIVLLASSVSTRNRDAMTLTSTLGGRTRTLEGVYLILTLFPQNYSRCSGGVKKSAFNSLIELKYLDRISSGKQLNNSETCFPKRSNILISNFMSRDIF